MSKELDYLDDLLENKPLTLVGRTIIECIKEKIQRLEAIDNANPSEALECLEEIKSQSPVCHYDDGSKSYVFEKEFTTIKQALENLKVIEVLQDGFSFSSYNPNGDYFVISFTIKENCDRKLINETLFGGSEVLKCQKE